MITQDIGLIDRARVGSGFGAKQKQTVSLFGRKEETVD